VAINAEGTADADVSHRRSPAARRRLQHQRRGDSGSAIPPNTGSASEAGEGPSAPTVDPDLPVLPTDSGRWHVNMPSAGATTSARETTRLRLLSDVQVAADLGNGSLTLLQPVAAALAPAWVDAQALLHHHGRTLAADPRASHSAAAGSGVGTTGTGSLFAAVRTHASTWASWNLMAVPPGELLALTGRAAPLGSRFSEVDLGDTATTAPAGPTPRRTATSGTPGKRGTHTDDHASVMELLGPGLQCYRDHMGGKADPVSGDVPHLASCVKLVAQVGGPVVGWWVVPWRLPLLGGLPGAPPPQPP
jgi:hypothetical protein